MNEANFACPLTWCAGNQSQFESRFSAFEFQNDFVRFHTLRIIELAILDVLALVALRHLAPLRQVFANGAASPGAVVVSQKMQGHLESDETESTAGIGGAFAA